MSSPRRATAVGFCLDVDGTLHRSGSVFVETLAHLGFCGALDLDAAERRHRRDVIGTVVEYDAGRRARRRWEGVLRGLDAVAVAGAPPLSDAVVSGLERIHAALPADSDPARRHAQRADGDGLDYRTMQRRALDAYGRLIAGRRPVTVQRAARAVVARHVATDPAVEAGLERLRAAGASVCLVTDAPAHAARAYARELPVAVEGVAGTRYAVDADGRFTGAYDVVDKGAAARRFRRAGEWERLIAAGDAVVDLAMAPSADLFLAVAGEGGLPAALDAPAGPDPPDCELVRVGPDRDLVPALVDALETVTDRPLAAGDAPSVDPESSTEPE